MFNVLKRILHTIFGGNTLDYICGTEALPLPLSGEEEHEAILLSEGGDSAARIAARVKSFLSSPEAGEPKGFYDGPVPGEDA